MSERRYGMIECSRGDGGVIAIALSNPARRNAIGARMVNELLWALEDAAEDDAVRTVVITGAAAGKAFCAGGDYAQMPVGEGELTHKGDYADLLLALLAMQKPVVARVNGAAMGGGLGIVAASHFAVAERDAKALPHDFDPGKPPEVPSLEAAGA
jgi:enoyl-CoA hydratase/carnithine racemase